MAGNMHLEILENSLKYKISLPIVYNFFGSVNKLFTQFPFENKIM